MTKPMTDRQKLLRAVGAYGRRIDEFHENRKATGTAQRINRAWRRVERLVEKLGPK